MANQIVCISGRIAQDPKVIQLQSGRTLFKLSIPEDVQSGGAPVTQWHTVAYFTGSEKETAYLTKALVKGAIISAQGSLRCEKVAHKEFPIDVMYWTIEASRIDVLHSPAPRTSDQDESAPAPAAAPTPAPAPAPAPAQPATRRDPVPAPAPAPAPAPVAAMGSPFSF